MGRNGACQIKREGSCEINQFEMQNSNTVIHKERLTCLVSIIKSTSSSLIITIIIVTTNTIQGELLHEKKQNRKTKLRQTTGIKLTSQVNTTPVLL